MTTYRYMLPVEDSAQRERHAAALWQAGANGLWQRDGRHARGELVAYFSDRHQPDTDSDSEDVPSPVGEGARWPVPAGGTWSVEKDRDWLASWKAGLEPVTVGDFVIATSWSGRHPGARTIIIDPEMAFGTGHHATTRLCLAALQDLAPEASSVLDVGTGTGVLAIGARLLGAATVVGIDSDPDAIATARANCVRNHVDVDLRCGEFAPASDRVAWPADPVSPPPDQPPVIEPHAVVVANITTTAVVELAGTLRAATRPGGHLIAGGIAAERIDEVVAVLQATGLRTVRTATEDGWAVVVATRQPVGVHG